MKKLLVLLIIVLLPCHRLHAQNITIDTILAKKYLVKAKSMLENRQFSKFDSILIYSDNAAMFYSKYQLWAGLLGSLSCQIEVYARNSVEENVLILNDSICKISNSKLGGETIYTANAKHCLGLVYYYLSKPDLALENYLKALGIRLKIIGSKNLDVSNSYNSIGIVYSEMSKYNEALEYYYKSLEIRKEILGEKNLSVAICFNNIGNVFNAKSEYKKAMEYFSKSLEILKEISGGRGNLMATIYSNIGVIYSNTSDYDKALDYQSKSIDIYQELYGEKSADLAISYMNISDLYKYKMEYDKALEYLNKALEILKAKLGEKHVYVATCYHDIGMIYNRKNEYDNALNYCLKGLKIREELLGHQHLDVAKSYSNLGNIYRSKKNYPFALDNNLKSLEILKSIFGEKHMGVAVIYSNIGSIYEDELNFDEALNYYFKDMNITKELLGLKHGGLSLSLNNIGDVYSKKQDYLKALTFYQKALYSNCKDFNDSTNVLNNPQCKNYFEPLDFLRSLVEKGRVFEVIADNLGRDKSMNFNGKNLSAISIYELALQNYLRCDTIIGQIRKKLNKISDKIALGESASKVYGESIRFCYKMSKLPNSDINKFKELTIYFTEQNKGMVLLEALAGAEGLNYAGIPDSLIKKEHFLKIDISFYENKLAEGIDSSTQVMFQSNLFNANRQYETLISYFEKNYPNYYKLKYSNGMPSVKEIQRLLNNKTAVRSYFVGDSNIYICTLTKSNIDLQHVKRISGLDDIIQEYRSALTGDPKFSNCYQRLGYQLYNQLFPEVEKIDSKIESIVVVPDGSLSFIPFESLPMGDFVNNVNFSQLQDSLRGFKNVSSFITNGNYKDFPFLIKRFNISYSYSATLFYQNSLVEEKNGSKDKPSWLAVAPVFSDIKQGFATQATHDLQRRIMVYRTDTSSTRGTLLNGDYVNSLPGTELETSSILKEFQGKGLNARILLKDEATEKEIKSGVLENYKILHFATHGFVNSEKPELSGLLLAQDSAGGEDGILYSGELYNLKLNADLTVLSACETGLGKVKRGEGIIGLTRALLYAGSKNIMVSLWPVSDQSTSDLMIDFYNNLINGKKNQSYSQCLRDAKLKMIKKGKYSNPFYWSPFILVGK